MRFIAPQSSTLMCVHFSCIAAILVSFIVCSVVYSIFFYFQFLISFRYCKVWSCCFLFSCSIMVNFFFRFRLEIYWECDTLGDTIYEWLWNSLVLWTGWISNWWLKALQNWAFMITMNVRISKQRRSKTIFLYIVT